MKISEFLRETNGSRITFKFRWLVWDEAWIVYERLPYKKRSTKIIETMVEENAIAALKGE